MKEAIGIFHIFLVFFQLFFPFLKFKNQIWNDKLYLVVIIVILLNWLVLKGECGISLMYKKMMNKNYKAGSDVMSLDDVKAILPFIRNEFVKVFFILVIFIIVPNMWMVNNRSKIISKNSMIIIISAYCLFILKMRKYYYKDLYLFLEENNINKGLDILSILFLCYILFYIIVLR